MKPEKRQLNIDRTEWRIGLTVWEVRRPRWLPEFESPGAFVVYAAVSLLASFVAVLSTPALGPIGCAAATFFVLIAVAVLIVGLLPRYGRLPGPLLVLGLGPTHLEISADWPNAPADRIAATLSGLGWHEAGGRRIPWAEIRGIRLSKRKTHIELLLWSGEQLRLPVAGARRWDRTLASIVEELDRQRRRLSGGKVPSELRDLQER